MKRVFFYLLFMLIVYVTIGSLFYYKVFSFNSSFPLLIVYCGVFGGVGGITYCLRGIYFNACVSNNWSDTWLPWYFIRPIVSFICGSISCIFLKSGLIILEAQQVDSSSNLAFYAFAFIAGLNVDKFIDKIEDVSQATWGIKKSRSTSKEA